MEGEGGNAKMTCGTPKKRRTAGRKIQKTCQKDARVKVAKAVAKDARVKEDVRVEPNGGCDEQ